MIATLLQGLIE